MEYSNKSYVFLGSQKLFHNGEFVALSAQLIKRNKFAEVRLGKNLCRDKITGAKEVAQSHVKANSQKLEIAQEINAHFSQVGLMVEYN